MINLERKLDSILRFDQLSYKEYPLNSISPVVKLNVLIVYLVCVVSVSKYDVFHIILLSSVTVFLLFLSPLTSGMVLTFMLYFSPFVFLVVIFNFIYNTGYASIGDYIVNRSGISSFIIMCKMFISLLVSLLLISTTPFSQICYSLKFFRLPRIFILQLMVMYRFIFIFLINIVQTTEVITSLANRSISWKDIKNILSTFFIRSLKISEDVYISMLARGFDIERFTLDMGDWKKDLPKGVILVLIILFMRFI